MSLKLTFYKTTIWAIGRGKKRGIPSNAKPLYILTLISLLEEGSIKNNNIFYDNQLLLRYTKVCQQFEPEIPVTPLYRPYFHLSSDSFYHIKWKDDSAPKGATAAPTSKYLREHVEYAYLDEELWELLQDEGARNEIKDAIVNFFIKPSTTL